MPGEYVPPEVDKEAFHCPHCNTYAHQKWGDINFKYSRHGSANAITDGSASNCRKCDRYTIWMDSEMVFPEASSAPQPSEDMPGEVKEHFEEARQIVDDSPRAASALLRLAMEELTQDLTGNEDQSLYANIGELVEEERIDTRVQRSLDAVRVTGNDMVHPGEIYAGDDRDTALRLFDLVNAVVELTITRENLIEENYSQIPEDKLKGIEQRDQN